MNGQDTAASPVPYEPADWRTWPIPEHGVLTRHPDGTPRRLSEYGGGWVDGFESALALVRRIVFVGGRLPDDTAPDSTDDLSDDDLPGMWSHSDFLGGDPDERSHAERSTPDITESPS